MCSRRVRARITRYRRETAELAFACFDGDQPREGRGSLAAVGEDQ
jgi:hypothetical protein